MRKAIILAAGEGTRMKSKKSKVLHELLGRPMIEYVIESAEKAGAEQIVIVAGENRAVLEERFGDRVSYAVQDFGEDVPYGTGYALACALDYIDKEDSILILCGDAPLFLPEGLNRLMAKREKNREAARLYGAYVNNPFGYGRIVERDGSVEKIVEEKDASPEERKINLVNSGVFAFSGEALQQTLSELSTDNAQGEMYLTDVIELLIAQDQKVGLQVLEDPEEMTGINSKRQLAEATAIFQRRINGNWMDQGVILENPESIYIEPDVSIGIDTIIQANVRLEGNTRIGEDCIIESGSVIRSSTIYNDVLIRQSVIEDSVVESHTDIGPFAHLRPGAHLKEKVHIGNFVKLKFRLGPGTKAGHLAYIGDADLEENNIGCGVIFVNYDGTQNIELLLKRCFYRQ